MTGFMTLKLEIPPLSTKRVLFFYYDQMMTFIIKY